MPSTPRQTFRVEEDLWKRFIRKAGSQGFTASEALRTFIRAVVFDGFRIEKLGPEKLRAMELDEKFLEVLEEYLRRPSSS